MNRLQSHPKLKLTHLNHRYKNDDERPRISRPDLTRELTGSGALRKNDDPHMSGGAVQKNLRKIKPLKF